MTDAEKRAKQKYKAKLKRFTIDFYPTETELFEHLAKQPKKQTYIKELIKADMRKNEQIADEKIKEFVKRTKEIFCNDGYIEIDEERFTEWIDDIAKEIIATIN